MAGSNLMNKVWGFFGIEPEDEEELDEEVENYEEEQEGAEKNGRRQKNTPLWL